VAASPAISASGLTKAYSETADIFDIDLEVPGGTVMMLLGPNGAGKTTALRILSTLLRPDRGTVRVGGFDVLTQPDRVQALIGVANQASAFDEKLSGRVNLNMFTRLHRLSWHATRQRTAELLERFDLTDAADKVVRSYSGGMRHKLDLAVSLIGRASILFFDEPTTGLDPASRLALWEIIRGLVHDGTTVLLTAQCLNEAHALADRVTLLTAAGASPGARRLSSKPAPAAVTPSSPRRPQTRQGCLPPSSARSRQPLAATGCALPSATAPLTSPGSCWQSSTPASSRSTTRCGPRVLTTSTSPSPAMTTPNSRLTRNRPRDERRRRGTPAISLVGAERLLRDGQAQPAPHRSRP
jgi:ABC-2 type transport system ATP-binding protein